MLYYFESHDKNPSCVYTQLIVNLDKNTFYVSNLFLLQIYRDNFERAYIEATEQFYSVKAPDQLNQHRGCVYSYMKYADAKLREEEQRALKYLETNVTGPTLTG